jgi:hypothetical protein
MERLVMLIDEYEERIVGVHSVWERINDKEAAWIISKKFWFIEQLLKRDEIKSDGIKPREDLFQEIQVIDFKTGKPIWWENRYSETEQLIMYLSIQDNPIEYLCSILKE